MFINNHLYEEQTQRLITETKNELNALEIKKQDIESKISKLQTEVQAYEMVLRNYRKRIGKPEVTEVESIGLFKGKTHKQKLMIIARKNDGNINVTQAANFLYDNGFVKSTNRRNVCTMVQAMLQQLAEEGKLIKIKPGTYKLIEQLELPISANSESTTNSIQSIIDSLRGMTQMEAVRTIARHNNGVINLSKAKNLLLEAGLSKGNPKFLVPHLYTQLKRSNEFEWIAPGTFKIKA